MLTVRCSKLPLARKCPPSVLEEPWKDNPLPKVNPVSDAAELGTAGHRVMQYVVDEDVLDLPDLNEYTSPTVSIDELTPLCIYAIRQWRELKPNFPNAKAEVALAYRRGKVHLTGHPDALSRDKDAACILDWKFGRADVDAEAQLRGLAFLANRPLVTAVLVNVRDAKKRQWKWTRADLKRWWNETKDRLLNWDGSFCPGDHCRFCDNFTRCPAHMAMIRSTFARIEIADQGAVNTLAPVELVKLYQLAGLADSRVQAFKAAVKTRVEALGPVEADGFKLSLTTTTKREFAPQKAWPVLSGYLDDEQLARSVKIQRGPLKKELMALADRGKKAEFFKNVEAELLAKGGLVVSEGSPRLELKRVD